LVIPPADGIYVQWKESDQMQRLADKYRVEVHDVLAEPVNKLDITDPVIEAGNFILFPGGYRETAAFNPVVYEYAPNSGVKKVIAGPGGCAWDYRQYGNGSFIWPSASHSLVGNDFGAGHMGVDLATVEGGPIYAADSGTVVYAGPIGGGYGIMVMIDHGTGYQTLYAHLSGVAVGCGQGVSQGQLIGYGGSTGNSTGPHLHFEVRYGGGYVNPWQFL
jgi:murein DD-endopeptidase MepM/ murein hydrolase activator NlpD